MRRWVLRVLPVATACVVATGFFVRHEPSPYEYGMAVLVLGAMAACALRYPRRVVLQGTLVAGFLVFSAVSLFYSGDRVASLRYLLITGYLAVSGMYFAGLLFGSGQQVERWLWRGYIVAGLLAAVLGWLGVVGASGFRWFVWGEVRAVAGFKDPNVYGAFLVPAFLYLLHGLRWARSRGVALWALGVGLIGAGQVLSFSRGAWLNLAVALAVYGALSRPRTVEEVRKIGLGFLFAGIWLGLAVALRPELASTALKRAGLMDYDEKRFAVQSELVESVRVNPWGVGPGETERVFGYAAHNLYLRVMVENGWFAGATFFVLLGLCVWSLFASALRLSHGVRRSAEAFLAAGLVGMLVNSLFIDSLHWRHLWMMLAISVWHGKSSARLGCEVEAQGR